MLFGKPNYTISEHYGSSMSGFVRADNPDTGPKYGEWSITREEIVNQLALQGLTEIDRGWITLQMRGEIPQQAGKMYFVVCDKIADKRSWFELSPLLKVIPTKKADFGSILNMIWYSGLMSEKPPTNWNWRSEANHYSKMRLPP